MGVAKSMGKSVEQFPPGHWVSKVHGRGERDPTWVIFFVDDAICEEVRWRRDGARCRVLTASPAHAHFQAIREREGEEILLPRKTITGWSRRTGASATLGRHRRHDVTVTQRRLEDL